MKKRNRKIIFAALVMAAALAFAGCGKSGGTKEDDLQGAQASETDDAEGGTGGAETGDAEGGTGGAETGDAEDGTGGTESGASDPEGLTEAEALREQMGFYVDGKTLYDANGNPFVMRGINHGHAWFSNQLGTALKAIDETGANTVRIVLSDGDDGAAKTEADSVSDIIAICRNLGMIVVLEVHDATGDNDLESMLNAARYFVDIKDVLIGQEDYVIINIANEWGGDWDSDRWYEGYAQAIPMLREAGLAHTIMVDACGWGQYGKCIDDHGADVLACDVLGNTMFSVHMYGTAGGSEQKIDENMGYALDRNLCLVIGEFGYNHSDGDVKEDYIMARCEELSVGYLAWSWKGNGGGVEYLDLAVDWRGNKLSEDWGEVVVNGPNGIRGTSVPCTVFDAGGQ